jgi:hypothetical protein
MPKLPANDGKIKLTFPQLMYSTATSRKKKYTRSPISYEDTKSGSEINEGKSYDKYTVSLNDSQDDVTTDNIIKDFYITISITGLVVVLS